MSFIDRRIIDVAGTRELNFLKHTDGYKSGVIAERG